MSDTLQKPRPVFLHGMWRSGSTYVWSRFRVADGTYCYYEPLNHGLGRLTYERIQRDTPEITAANAHPALSTPYFTEYRPLLQRRGVKHFSPRFSYERFALNETEADEKLQHYISSLVDAAQNRNKIPVLGFNASDLRVDWMNHNFDPISIHINRDPLDIWVSYQKFSAKGNYTFFAAWMNIIEKNSGHPVFSPLAQQLHLRRGLEKFLCRPKSYYRAILQGMKPEDTYAMIFYIWRASTLHALSHCAHIIDMDRADESGYARKLAGTLRDSCGVDVSFDDLRANDKKKRPDFDYVRVEQKILEKFSTDSPLFDKESIRRNLQNLAARKEDLIRQGLS